MDNPEHILKSILSHVATPPVVFGAMAISFGAFVGGLIRISKEGWSGWVKFGILVIINMFFGLVAYLVSISQELSTINAVVAALLFGSLGEKGGGWFFENFQGAIVQNILDFFRWKMNTK